MLKTVIDSVFLNPSTRRGHSQHSGHRLYIKRQKLSASKFNTRSHSGSEQPRGESVTLIGGFGVVGGNRVHRQLFPQSLPSFKVMWIVNSEQFFPNAQPNYWQVFEGANQGGLLIISEHLSLWWGIKKAFICPSGPAPNCKHQEHLNKVHQPGLLMLSNPTSHCSHLKYHNPTITNAVSKQGWETSRKPANAEETSVSFICALSWETKKRQECFTSRPFNQFTSLSSDVNFLGQIWVELGATEWGQFFNEVKFQRNETKN